MKTSSWVIIRKATGKAVFETFSKKTADRVNRDKYDVVPILDYLVALNASIRALDRPGDSA